MLAAVERVVGNPDAAALLAGPLCAALCDALLEQPAAAAAAARHVGSNGSEEAVDSAAVGAGHMHNVSVTSYTITAARFGHSGCCMLSNCEGKTHWQGWP